MWMILRIRPWSIGICYPIWSRPRDQVFIEFVSLALREQSDQIFAMTDPIAERVRKIGGQTLRSIGNIARLQRVKDNDADYVSPLDMLAELRDDNQHLAASMREAHGVCEDAEDVASASHWLSVRKRACMPW